MPKKVHISPFPLLILGIGLLFLLLAGGTFSALAQGRADDFTRMDEVLKGLIPSPALTILPSTVFSPTYKSRKTLR